MTSGAQAVNVIWVGPNNSFWDIAANWNTGLPSALSNAQLGAFNTEFRSGNLALQSFVGTGQLTISGGTLAPSAASSIGGLVMTGGTLAGDGTVAVNGASGWTGGTMSGTGTTTFNSALSLSGGSNTRVISGRPVTVAGTTTWSNAFTSGGSIGLANGATLNNTGVWLDQLSNAQTITSSGAANTFSNSGSYTKSGGTTTDIQTRFNNTGTVTVSNNTLFLSGGGNLTNRLDAAGGATLQLNAGTFGLTGLVAASGSGLLNVATTVNATGSNSFGGSLGVSAGVLDVSGTFDANGFSMSGGTLTGTGAVNINGASGWTGGTMSGTGTTTFNSALSLSGGSNTRVISGRPVTVAGTTTWSNAFTSGGSIGLANGATLNNTGVWLDQLSNAQTITSSGAANTFNNSGSYVKTGNVNTNLSAINYVNTGVTDVRAGTIQLPASFVNTGKLMGSGTLAAATITNSGRVAPGALTGTMTIAGNFLQTALGSFDVELESPLSRDLLNVTGTANLGGTLSLICFSGCNFAVGTPFRILDAAPNALIGSFASVTLTGFSPDSFFNVIYDRANGDVLLNGFAAAVPEPGTWAMLLSGVAVLAFMRRRRVPSA